MAHTCCDVHVCMQCYAIAGVYCLFPPPLQWDVGPHSQPLTYSCVAGASMEVGTEFLDIITPEEAASLVRCHHFWCSPYCDLC